MADVTPQPDRDILNAVAVDQAVLDLLTPCCPMYFKGFAKTGNRLARRAGMNADRGESVVKNGVHVGHFRPRASIVLVRS